MTHARRFGTLVTARLVRAIVRSRTCLALALLTSPVAALGNRPPRFAGAEATQPVVLNPIPHCHDNGGVADNPPASAGQSCGVAASSTGDYVDSDDTGEPVMLHNGMVTCRYTDMLIPGRGMPFEFTRRYNSKRSEFPGPLGYGWDHSFNLHLDTTSAGLQVTLYNGNNRLDSYTRVSTAVDFDSPKGVYNRLIVVPGSPGGFIIRRRDGMLTTFEYSYTSGSTFVYRLKSIEDADENAITCQYDTATPPRLVGITDTLGRQITISYVSTAPTLIDKVTDFAGRDVVYSYNTSGDLISVRTPTVTSTSEGGTPFNDFTSGRTESYTYSSGSGTASLNHNLLTIVRPNEQGITPARPAVEFTYYTSGSTNGYADWCETQTLGTTAGSFPCGGPIHYYYSTVPTMPTTAILRTLVRDRRGNETDYYFDSEGHAVQIVERSGTSTTILATTSFQYNVDGEITQIDFPEGNYETRTYATGSALPASIQRYVQGNLDTVTFHADATRGDGGTGSLTTTRSYVWEPVYNHLCKAMDELGRETNYVCAYMEGDATSVAPNIQAEMGISSTDAAAIAGMSGLLKNMDVNGDGIQSTDRGNVVAILQPTTTLPTVGTPPMTSMGQVGAEHNYVQDSTTSFTYNDYGQRTSMTDGEQNVSVYLYYPETKPFDGSTSSGAGTDAVTGGYLRRTERDVALPHSDAQLSTIGVRSMPGDSTIGRETGFDPQQVEARTDYVYDSVGNVVSMTDPRGVRTDFFVNELNEVWKVIRAADVSAVSTRFGGADPSTAESLTGQNFAFVHKYKYDANGNVVLELAQNTGNNSDTGAVSGFIETETAYDVLDNVRTITQEVGETGQTIQWSYSYDGNENLTDTLQPEGNVEHRVYDERDLLVTIVQGYGVTGQDSTVSFGYDKNRNRTTVEDGLSQATTFEYDGYDRQIRALNLVGTEIRVDRDAASNVTSIDEIGATDGTFTTIHSLRTSYLFYDERNRLTQVDVEDPHNTLSDGALTAADGRVSRRMDYDRLSRCRYVYGDDVQQHLTHYDGVGRVIRTEDHLGNTVEYAWDDCGNLVVKTSQDAGFGRYFTDFNVYDSLGRQASATDNLGQTTRYTYDSRDNCVQVTDAKSHAATQTINGQTVNGDGNATHYFHDGLSRLVKTEMDITTTGFGGDPIDTSNAFNGDGIVRLLQEWDGNSRLTEQSDDRRKPTVYAYDASNRLVAERFADLSSGASNTYAYDAASNLITKTDRRGDTITYGYDTVNRLTSVSCSPGSGVVGTTDLVFEYDGLNRRTMERDSVDAVLDGNDWIVTRTWDALGRVLTETQNGRTITNTWTEEAKRTSLDYSSTTNPLTVSYAYDALDRMESISAGGVALADYKYKGPDRLLERKITVQVSPLKVLLEKHYTGTYDDTLYWDDVGRPTKLETFNRVGTLQSGFEHGFDENNNRTYERRLHASSDGDNYFYDSLSRLTTLERGVTSTGVGASSPTNAGVVNKAWALDGVHNWRSVATTTGSGATTSTATVNNVNEYTTFGAEAPQHDLDGNLTSPDTGAGTPITLSYDFLSRLREITNGTAVVSHDYDAYGRRVRTTSSGVSAAPPFVEYVYDGWEVIEECDGSNVVMRRFVMGRELDEPLRMETFSAWPNLGAYYYQRSTLGNVVSISNSAGAVVERYTYGAYGVPQFEDAGNVIKSVASSEFGNPYLFVSRRFEPWLYAVYEWRYRFMQAAAGRFIQRDPLGVWGDTFNFGNALAYVGGCAPNRIDPFGDTVYLVSSPIAGHGSGGAVANVFGGHKGVLVQKDPKQPGERIDGTSDGKGGLVVHWNNPGNGNTPATVEAGPESGGEGGTVTEVPPPKGVPQDEWDEAIIEAAATVGRRLGGKRWRPGWQMTGPQDGPTPTAPVSYANSVFGIGGSDCWDVYASIYRIAHNLVRRNHEDPYGD